MKNKLFLIGFLICFQINGQTVFKSGMEGHKTYRIPAIIQTKNKILLAFSEGRVNGSGDFGDINIVMKISKNNGKTWSKLETVVDYDQLQAGNPAPVIDYFDPKYPNGRIFLFYNTGNNTEWEVRKGNGTREVWYKTSVDNGKSWSEPVNITNQVHRPNQPKTSANYSFSEDWRSYANTPGHAIQFEESKYKGRIFVAANHSEAEPKSDFTDYFSHGFYTDDHGISFKLSEKVNIGGSNEATAAELPNGSLMLNARNQKGDIRARIVAISKNGGQSWDSTYFDKNLPDPVCEGSLLKIGKYKGKNILAFCNAADKLERDNLTVKFSNDNGKNWQKSISIDKSETKNQKDFTAYSDIVLLGNNKIGVLYERNNYAEIVFKIVNI